MIELALTQERSDDSRERFRVSALTLGIENHPVGWVLVDLAKWDGSFGGCLVTTSKENAERLRAEAEKRGGLVPVLHSMSR
jgi:hypothetical protein